MVAAAMTALIPGAGPPPTRIASVFGAPITSWYPRGQRGTADITRGAGARSEVGEEPAGADHADPQHERDDGGGARPRRHGGVRFPARNRAERTTVEEQRVEPGGGEEDQLHAEGGVRRELRGVRHEHQEAGRDD